MTIAVDARIINTGTGRYIERLLNHLEEVDDQNDYVILVRAKDKDYYKPRNPKFRIEVADFDDYSFAEQVGFLKFLNRLQPDLVHFCMPQQPVLYKGTHVTTVHDLTLLKTYNSDKNWLVFHLKQLVGRYVFRKIAKTSAHIITPTEFTKQEYVAFSGIPEDRVTVTYEAVGTDLSSPEPYDPMMNQEFIMYLGAQSDYKNIRRLIQAHQEVRKVNPDLYLVLVGRMGGNFGKPARRNKAWVEQEGLEGVVFTDYLPDKQAAWLYKNTQAYVFPSLMEGFGLPALEAMAGGAPVISSSATCLPEVYGDAAIYFDPTDVNDMAKKISEVIESDKLQNDLRQRGAERVNLYSWRRMAEQTLEVYKKALGA
jgi:glycosyltransferase involved in cell wall biosynthesis